ncbi:MAG: toll/interleukin-1 receptor domain-containing protein [Pseudomonadota bacterium]
MDLLVVSAFPGDYTPTPNSLIGALARRGISVASLAQIKARDLREEFAFWITPDLSADYPTAGFQRLACFESNRMESPPEQVDDLIKGLFGILDPAHPATLAMPVLASGDQGWSKARMFMEIVVQARTWMSAGLPIADLRIVLRTAEEANAFYTNIHAQFYASPMMRVRQFEDHFDQAHADKASNWMPLSKPSKKVFLSYASADAEAAKLAETTLLARRDVATVFNYKSGSIPFGSAWIQELKRGILEADRVVALISPDYLTSRYCKNELMMTETLQWESRDNFLLPIYWRAWEGDLDLWLKGLQAANCLEAQTATLQDTLGQKTLFRA